MELNSRDDLVKHLNSFLLMPVTSAQVKINPYGYDERTGWETYIVKVTSQGVVGFTDGPVDEQ
ncbi:hypothetical protein [Geotalea sp. SG265]|uniref:hypothetical protein n=1 Tax=Geotalea sp. SG265 TaxID=2922867 RepID=UPI001FB0426D|nr:hypothetical protein [Geotalea sp. SG265]